MHTVIAFAVGVVVSPFVEALLPAKAQAFIGRVRAFLNQLGRSPE